MTTPTERLEAESWARRAERELRATVETQSAELKELRSLLNFFDSARQAPIAPPTWEVRPQSGSEHVGLIVAQFTDWHLDEVVKPEEIFDLNAYNREIALMRLRRWAEKVITLPRDYFAGVKIEGLVIPSTGDILNGDIHAELKESNEDHLLASLLFWAEQVIAMLELLEREYDGRVSLHAVPGNHTRTTQKPVFKGRAKSNLEWLFWSIVRDRLVDRGSRVRVEVSNSMDLNVPIYGRNHLLTHGDQFKGGSGISGAFAPLSLGTHRKSKRQMAAKMPMDLMVVGHLHQYIDIPGLIMGGSGVGYDEFAFGNNLPPEPARQALWVTTPERGKTMAMPVELQDRAAEGW